MKDWLLFRRLLALLANAQFWPAFGSVCSRCFAASRHVIIHRFIVILQQLLPAAVHPMPQLIPFFCACKPVTLRLQCLRLKWPETVAIIDATTAVKACSICVALGISRCSAQKHKTRSHSCGDSGYHDGGRWHAVKKLVSV